MTTIQSSSVAVVVDDFEPRDLVRRFSERTAEQVDAGESNGVLRTIIADDYRPLPAAEPNDESWRRHFEPWTPCELE